MDALAAQRATYLIEAEKAIGIYIRGVGIILAEVAADESRHDLIFEIRTVALRLGIEAAQRLECLGLSLADELQHLLDHLAVTLRPLACGFANRLAHNLAGGCLVELD